MRPVIDFLTANTTVFLATSEAGKARVRPFQFQFARDGRLWFCTSCKKEVYAQLLEDPRLELSAMGRGMATLRLLGKAVFDDDMTVKERIIDTNALVRSIYGTADNPDFTVFAIDHGTAFLFDLSGNPPQSFSF